MAVTNFNKVDVSDVSGFSVAGVPITATPAELNALAGQGVVAADAAKLHAITVPAAEINAQASSQKAVDGLGNLGVARVTFDAAIAGNQSVAAHPSAVTLPINAIVVGGFFDVNTAFHSAGGDAGTIAISVEGANDIQTAAAVSGAPYSTIGRKAIVPKANTPESTGVKATAARAITFTVAGQILSAGKLTLFLYYVVSVPSA